MEGAAHDAEGIALGIVFGAKVRDEIGSYRQVCKHGAECSEVNAAEERRACFHGFIYR